MSFFVRNEEMGGPGDYPIGLIREFSTHLLRLEAFIAELDFEAFLRRVDHVVAETYPQLCAYLSPTQAQLVLLKLTNLLVLKFEYRHRHGIITAHPIGVQVDPSNSCPLSCPGCAHTKNRAVNNFIWPNGVLDLETFGAFMADHGPFLFEVYFANYGEPLLNKRLAEFVRLARRFYVPTYSSTSLSVPKIDPAAIVESGLSFLIVSIDGVTEPVYAKYRKGGNLELAMRNLRDIIRAKEERGSYTPVLHWQFLLFEHNKHEADAAIATARDLGVNEIRLARPYGVAWDDPEILTARDRPYETIQFDHDGNRLSAAFDKAAGDLHADIIARHFETSWLERWAAKGRPVSTNAVAAPGAPGCEWLYKSFSLDSTGRVMPCARPPSTTANLVFAHQGEGDVVNGDLHQRARLFFADPAEYRRVTRGLPDEQVPYCSSCEHPNTKLDIDTREIVASHLRTGGLYQMLDADTRQALTDW